MAEVTPTSTETPRPGRRRFWWIGGAVLLAAAAGVGYAFQDNFAALGAYRYDAPPSFKGLELDNSRASSANNVMTRYGGPAEGDVTVTVHQQYNFLPSTAMDDAIRRLGRAGVSLRDAHRADPGPRGGVMTCGTLPSESWIPMAMCVWADSSMQGVFSEMRTRQTLDVAQVAQDTRDFRALAETPS